jgi:hypothetical protein
MKESFFDCSDMNELSTAPSPEGAQGRLTG